MACRLVCPTTLLAALVAAIVISACGGSSNTSGSAGGKTVTVVRTVTGGGPASGSSSATTAARTGTTSATTTTTAPSGPPACASAELTPLSLGSNGAAGTVMYYFALRNTGGHSCHTYGWPGVSFLTSSGAMLPTNVTRTTTDMAGTVKPTAITLKAGKEASFRVSVSQAYNGGADCRSASFLQIYAPDDTVAMRVAVPHAAASGKATVTPLQKGRAAMHG